VKKRFDPSPSLSNPIEKRRRPTALPSPPQTRPPQAKTPAPLPRTRSPPPDGSAPCNLADFSGTCRIPLRSSAWPTASVPLRRSGCRRPSTRSRPPRGAGRLVPRTSDGDISFCDATHRSPRMAQAGRHCRLEAPRSRISGYLSTERRCSS
jgi:hypothetical protein